MALNTGDLVGPYEILALLGAGGMGEVYKARDSRLHRLVALKTLSPSQVAETERKQRFLLEARAASKLNHPNIVTIYDVLAENGISFIAMEYVEGVTLEQMHTETGVGLPLKDALKYAAEIADALAAAHSAGIVHRDLKPANVIITKEGRAKLLDFGLAKLTEPKLPTLDAETATFTAVTGTIIGTAPYMSPEQAEGREIDARSDIFSFGLVLYEILSGTRAFHGDSWISIIAAILHEEPRPLQDVRPDVPPTVAQCVARCLRKDPADRFQSMSDVRRALDAGISAPTSIVTKEAMQSIAILPFVNLTADKENEYFGDGLAEEILNALAKVPNLKVIARTSAFAFRGQEHNLRAIAERLRVRTILEGSVRRAGNRIRIATQLINVADESQLWSERFDREMTDIFAIQDEISQAIANALKVNLGIPQRRAGNIEAFQSYLQGLYWYQRYTAESLAKAKDSFEQALAQDPGYAPAHAGLAVFYYGVGALSIRRMTEMAPLAQSAAEKALAMDPTLREAHSVLGLLAATAHYDWKLAETHFQAAMAVDPVPPLVRVRYALYFLTPQKRFEEAIVQYKRALETDPLSMMVHFGLSFALYCQRQLDSAIEHAEKAVNLYPDYWLVHFAMGLALLQKGELECSIASLETTVKLSPSFTLGAGFLAAAYVRAGRLEKADELIQKIAGRTSSSYVSPCCFAIYYAALGQSDRMFGFIESALADRDPYLTRLDAEPCFEPFRSDPRYRDLLARMNLAQNGQPIS
jgi:serine/threonine protein kinase/Tfp pilus assembly protein PilF